MGPGIPLAGVMGWPVEHSLSPKLHGFWLQEMDIGGYYFPDPALASRAMRPSATFNTIIDQFGS